MSTELIQAPEGAVTTYAPPRALMPVVNTRQLVARRDAIKEAMSLVMRENTHYGKIPGTNDKLVLLKPGAEEICALFGLTPRFLPAQFEEDFTGERHGGEPFFGFVSRCQLWQGDWLVAEAQGSCNSWEKKYRWRKADRVCPSCGAATILRSNKDDEWFCWKKKGGCGATFPLNSPEIMGQKVGDVPNPDVADLHNTIIKMADKRALVAAVLIATGASAMFTQDIEDAGGPTQYDRSYQPDAQDSRQQPTAPRNGTNGNGNGHAPAQQQSAPRAAAQPTGTAMDAEKAWQAACDAAGMPKDPEARMVLLAELLSEFFKSKDPNHKGIKLTKTSRLAPQQYQAAIDLLEARRVTEGHVATSAPQEPAQDAPAAKAPGRCPVPTCKNPTAFECGCTREEIDAALAAEFAAAQRNEPSLNMDVAETPQDTTVAAVAA